MPQISFVKNKAPITVEAGSNLMQSLLTAGVPVASSCKGDGICCKCVIQIIKGMENLSSPNPREQDLRERNSVPPEKRVSCQTQILGDITIDTGYW